MHMGIGTLAKCIVHVLPEYSHLSIVNELSSLYKFVTVDEVHSNGKQNGKHHDEN